MKRFALVFAALLLSGQAHAQDSKHLPDGVVSTGSNDVAEAWLTRPTTRYAHGILGDAIEAGDEEAARAAMYRHIRVRFDAMLREIEGEDRT